jgi:hypothetical protein
MEACGICARPARRWVDLAKDGSLHQAWVCESGHVHCVDTHESQAVIAWAEERGLKVAGVAAGSSLYVLDRRFWRRTLRTIVHRCRSAPQDLALDLSSICFVGKALLGLLERLCRGLRARGHDLWVVAPSWLLAADLRQVAPSLGGRVVTRLADAVAAARGRREAEKGQMA